MMYKIFCNKGKLVTTDIHMYIMVVKIRHSIHTHTHTHMHMHTHTHTHYMIHPFTCTQISRRKHHCPLHTLHTIPHHEHRTRRIERLHLFQQTEIIYLRSTVICCIKSLLHDNLASAPREDVPKMKRLLNTVAAATHLSRSTPVVCVHLCKQPIVLEKQGLLSPSHLLHAFKCTILSGIINPSRCILYI
jgi:hypothetical protein